MSRPLRALIVDDSETNVQQVLDQLRRGGYAPEHRHVATRTAMGAALDEGHWDVVVAAHSTAGFDGMEAFAVIKGRGLDLPLIILIDVVNEEIAVGMLRAGVHDLVVKDRMARLVPAIERELREVSLRTERKTMQEQLLLSDRMATIGMLAAGVAHEINNPLSALTANIEVAVRELARLGQELPLGTTAADGNGLGARIDDLQEAMCDARESVERVRHIVRDLKLFSRRSDDEPPQPTDIRRVLESSLRIAWNEIRYRARLVKDYAQVPLVMGNEARLGQVFLNLLINAAHAIPEGKADTNEIRILTRTDSAGRAVVEVRDTGSGIPAEIRARIFDPFFTTKPIGVGTGLGLSISNSIVQALKGEIQLESEVGRGSTFRVLLPAAPAAADRPVPAAAPGPGVRRARLLVVDDEVIMGRAVQRMLSPEHEVVVATSAREGLDALGSAAFDLVLCDLMMPEMTGMELHAELARTRPELLPRMIFVTGGAFTPRAREFLDHVNNPRIEKPFNAQNLRAVINNMLR